MFSLGISLHDWQTGVGAWQMRTSNLDVIGYSRLVGIGIIILIYKILQQKKNLFLIPVVIAMGVCQFLLRERGPIYFTLLSSVLIILFMVKSRFRLLVISLSVLAAFFLVNSYVSIDQRFDPRLILSDSRTLIIERSISLIMENPIFGVGTGSFSLSGNNPTQREYSHNIFLELMTENGVFGLGIFIITIIIVITSVRDVSKKLVSNSDSKLLFILFTYSFLQAQVSGDLSNNYFVWIFGSTIIGYEGFLKTHLPMKRGISINGK
jgi:O-antigen ligase